MKSHKISIHKNSGFTRTPKNFGVSSQGERGFTIIEILVVMAILVGFVGMGLFYTMDAYRGNLFRSESGMVINLLQKARNQSVNNINQIPHGVKFKTDEIVVFHGNSYVEGATENDVFERKAEVSITTTLPGDLVIFDQLTGNVDPAETWEVTVQFGARSTTIEINNEGRINW